MEIKKKKVIFKKDKFEKEMIEKIGLSELLLLKLNSDNFYWANEIDNEDISKILTVVQENGEEYFIVKIVRTISKDEDKKVIGSNMFFVMPRWCDIV
jgi:hypothetical protein